MSANTNHIKCNTNGIQNTFHYIKLNQTQAVQTPETKMTQHQMTVTKPNETSSSEAKQLIPSKNTTFSVESRRHNLRKPL